MKLTKIHEDDRGTISLLTEDMKWDEVTIFHTKAGRARGGCIHNINDEFNSIIEGEIIYKVGKQTYHLKTGDSCFIPAGKPHYFMSITDSIVLEWGATPAEKKEKHKEFRLVVDQINQTVGDETYNKELKATIDDIKKADNNDTTI